MTKSTMSLAAVCISLLIALAAVPASATVWDLATDFASVDNNDPSGIWHFGITNHAPYSGNPPTAFTQLFTQYQLGYGTGELGGGPAWMDPNQYWVGICQSDGNATGGGPYDFPLGKVGGHGPTGASWTAPRDMVVNITGDAWMIRIPPLGRVNSVLVAVDGIGFLLPETEIPQQFGTNSSNPLRFAFNNISVSQGQNVWLSSKYLSAYDYVGFDLTIAEVPEPGSLCALAGGIVGLVGFAIRRRR
ncbi:MAG: PEP-CTERM sorting domain-containing protein [Armatimonadetes bacterium]|nr:PEP-CTERM sorting domain-containing protein [Armatimonadota bacterium]